MMKQKIMTDYFCVEKKERRGEKEDNEERVGKKRKIEEKVFGYNEETDSWHCVECGVDMGPCNPRQLCRKSFCENYFI
jgi:hypothetical protein